MTSTTTDSLIPGGYLLSNGEVHTRTNPERLHLSCRLCEAVVPATEMWCAPADTAPLPLDLKITHAMGVSDREPTTQELLLAISSGPIVAVGDSCKACTELASPDTTRSTR